MKIGLQTWGSDGDIRPFIALAGGLRKAGHDVTLAVASVDRKDYSALAASLDFKVIHTQSIPRCSLDETALKILRTNLPFAQIKILMEEHFAPYQEEMFETATAFARECDLLVGHHIAGSLKAAAEKCLCDYVSVFLCHSFIPSDHTAPYPLPSAGRFMNRLLWKLGGAIADAAILEHFNLPRKNHGNIPLSNIIHSGWKSDKLNLIAVSPNLCRKQPDWDDSHQVCGFFDIPLEAEEWRPPPDLQAFLDRGDPPVYFTFGSMTQMFVGESTLLLVEAAMRSGKRAIVQSHWDRVAGIPESGDIYRISKVPHHHIFPRCALAVHHGGAGTTQSAARSGIPSVVVHHAFDQQFWGSELARLGICGKVLNRRGVTAQRIAAEVRAMFGSETAREKARAIGNSMRAENGVSRAVELIEKKFG